MTEMSTAERRNCSSIWSEKTSAPVRRAALRLAASGTPVIDVCRQIGVSEATYYTWKKKYADLGVTELRRLKTLEDEEHAMKRIAILREVVRKNLEGC